MVSVRIIGDAGRGVLFLVPLRRRLPLAFVGLRVPVVGLAVRILNSNQPPGRVEGGFRAVCGFFCGAPAGGAGCLFEASPKGFLLKFFMNSDAALLRMGDSLRFTGEGAFVKGSVVVASMLRRPVRRRLRRMRRDSYSKAVPRAPLQILLLAPREHDVRALPLDLMIQLPLHVKALRRVVLGRAPL